MSSLSDAMQATLEQIGNLPDALPPTAGYGVGGPAAAPAPAAPAFHYGGGGVPAAFRHAASSRMTDTVFGNPAHHVHALASKAPNASVQQFNAVDGVAKQHAGRKKALIVGIIVVAVLVIIIIVVFIILNNKSKKRQKEEEERLREVQRHLEDDDAVPPLPDVHGSLPLPDYRDDVGAAAASSVQQPAPGSRQFPPAAPQTQSPPPQQVQPPHRPPIASRPAVDISSAPSVPLSSFEDMENQVAASIASQRQQHQPPPEACAGGTCTLPPVEPAAPASAATSPTHLSVAQTKTYLDQAIGNIQREIREAIAAQTAFQPPSPHHQHDASVLQNQGEPTHAVSPPTETLVGSEQLLEAPVPAHPTGTTPVGGVRAAHSASDGDAAPSASASASPSATAAASSSGSGE